MSDREKREQEIMNQELSQDEMDTVAGGGYDIEYRDLGCQFAGAYVHCKADNALKNGRELYRPDKTVNCANTVEDGSHCDTNDACYDDKVVYLGMEDCHKAWK
ncbi:MAG: hypothetical protein IKH57_04215 [Clostridia bacterium]|nr:hypothetical protein [Clostridia bacterium]